MQTQTKIPDIKVLRTYSNGVGYLKAREIAAQNNMRLPFSRELGAVLLDDKARKSVKAMVPGWLDTGYALGEKNGRLPRGKDIVDSNDSRLILLAEYVKKAEIIAADRGIDLYAPNTGIIYNIAGVEQLRGKIIFHPHEIFVQQFLAESGWGKLNPQTYVAEPVSKEEFNGLEWALQSWFGRIDGVANRPLARGNIDFCDDRRRVFGDWGLADGLWVAGVKLDGPLPRVTFAALEKEK